MVKCWLGKRKGEREDKGMINAFEKIMDRLEEDCWLTTNDDGETNELSIIVVSLEDANKIVQEVAEEYKNGHFGCNFNGEHEKCKDCCITNCKKRNAIWFGLDVPDTNVGNKWIPCSERLPEEHETIFAKLKGTDKWSDAMFEKISDDVNVTVEFDDGTRKTMTLHTNDGKWNTNNRIVKFNVIAWQPLPEPFKESD